jgi:nitrogen regulatory protein P-II 1
MPPRWYALLRPATRLSASERQDLIRGLDATLGSRKLGTKGGTGAGKDALMGLGVGGITVTEVRGSGHESDRIRDHPNAEYKVDLVPKAAVEVVVADDDVASVVATICQVARTGLVGDGKVFVLPVSAAIRIRTGETGEGVLC